MWLSVQGVFFRKHTKKAADKLGLVGWVENTPTGSVRGVVQGPEDAVGRMKVWLSSTGSPKSVIAGAAVVMTCLDAVDRCREGEGAEG